ncbi:MAG: prolipoprotein diacylglyceryl transferase [Ruminococcaceae bacterium]|nr:prolipoprotein diacylglyceryl transferase [Oscillospiraceae bacterium]
MFDKIKIAFPGLGIGRFEVDSTAFKIFGFEIQWYGVIITLGIILAVIYCSFRAKQEGIIFDHVLDITIFTVIFGVIGARLGYVLFSLDDFHSFADVINIRGGGLQIYGGIVAGAITIILVCKYKKIKPLKMLDATAPAVMIGQFVGRWGNFMNGEAHGGIVKEGSPLYFLRMELEPYYMNGRLVYDTAAVHPTFLYESLWNVLGFVLINILYKKKKFDGQILLMYISWYGFGRMFIEMLRTDSLYLGNTGIRISCLIGFLCFAAGTTLLTVFLIRERKKAELTDEDYVPAYPRLSGMNASADASADASANETAESVSSEESHSHEQGLEDKAEQSVEESTEEMTAEAQVGTDENKDEIEQKFKNIFNNDEKSE